jgi:hypothetical protein
MQSFSTACFSWTSSFSRDILENEKRVPLRAPLIFLPLMRREIESSLSLEVAGIG